MILKKTIIKRGDYILITTQNIIEIVVVCNIDKNKRLICKPTMPYRYIDVPGELAFICFYDGIPIDEVDEIDGKFYYKKINKK